MPTFLEPQLLESRSSKNLPSYFGRKHHLKELVALSRLTVTVYRTCCTRISLSRIAKSRLATSKA